MKKRNKHIGSSLDDFLKEEGVLEETRAAVLKETLAWQVQQAMEKDKISKVEMARRMNTSRAALDRLLDPGNERPAPVGPNGAESSRNFLGPSLWGRDVCRNLVRILALPTADIHGRGHVVVGLPGLDAAIRIVSHGDRGRVHFRIWSARSGAAVNVRSDQPRRSGRDPIQRCAVG